MVKTTSKSASRSKSTSPKGRTAADRRGNGATVQGEGKDASMGRKDANTNKTKALELALGQIDKAFGSGSIMRLNEDQIRSCLLYTSPSPRD